MTNNNTKTKIINYEDGKEAVMVRIDKTVKEMVREKPSSRWDAGYWHPKFENIFKDVNFRFAELKEFILPETEGITYGSTKPREWSDEGNGVKYIKSANVRNTGLDIVNIHWTPEGGSLDGHQYRVKPRDLIMNKSGTGTFGRLFVINKDHGKMVVSQDTMRIRVNNISPYYVAVYLQTYFGNLQVQRFTAGVSGQVHINFEDIKAIKIPLLPDSVQLHIKQEYLKMSKIHNKAMREKEKGNEEKCKKNLEFAKNMLENLVSKTEAVIRGKQEDVI